MCFEFNMLKKYVFRFLYAFFVMNLKIAQKRIYFYK